uniref:SH2 domain-containing protein n=1 Tax=Eptatretus burgeri TaxID=7764 RepID=A0A8C4NHC9_EPTBU
MSPVSTTSPVSPVPPPPPTPLRKYPSISMEICETNDGAYLLRESSRQESSQPYTLVVYQENEVYNVPVRFLEPEGKYALGMEKAGEELFDSLEEITEYFRYKPLFLIGRKQNEGKPTYLGYPAQL